MKCSFLVSFISKMALKSLHCSRVLKLHHLSICNNALNLEGNTGDNVTEGVKLYCAGILCCDK